MSNVIQFPPQAALSAVMEAAALRALEAFVKTPEGKAALNAEFRRLQWTPKGYGGPGEPGEQLSFDFD